MNVKQSKIIICIAILVVTAILGCAQQKGRSLDELIAEDQKKEDYRARIGDVLSVKVWGEAQLSGDIVVREDGKFTMQLINDVEAAGHRLEDISVDIAKRLEKFVPGASVVVSLSQTAPIKFYLLGSFQRPGDYRSAGRISFLQAIAMGGGLAPFADEANLAIIRKSAEGDRRYILNYDRVSRGIDPNPDLRDGDIIQVK